MYRIYLSNDTVRSQVTSSPEVVTSEALEDGGIPFIKNK